MGADEACCSDDEALLSAMLFSDTQGFFHANSSKRLVANLGSISSLVPSPRMSIKASGSGTAWRAPQCS